MIGGGTGIGGQLELGDDIIIAGFGMVTKSIDKRDCIQVWSRWRKRGCGGALWAGSSGWT